MIAGLYPADVRIVRTWPGPGTGDSYYETEDGRTWVTRPSYGPYVTGVTYGSVIGDRMVTPPRSDGVPYYPPRRPVFFDRPKPTPEPEQSAERPTPSRPPRPRRPPVLFVGAGPMHRRWR